MLEGASGTGKSSLALALLEKAQLSDFEATLICDDQALIAEENGQLFASAPEALAGKIEVRGFGILEIPYVPRAEISRIFKLVDFGEVPRLGDSERVDRFGVQLEAHKLPIGCELQQIRLIFLHLGLSVVAV